MKVKEWVGMAMTRKVLHILHKEGQARTNAVLSATNRDKMADSTLGFIEAINFIERLTEEDIPDE